MSIQIGTLKSHNFFSQLNSWSLNGAVEDVVSFPDADFPGNVCLYKLFLSVQCWLKSAYEAAVTACKYKIKEYSKIKLQSGQVERLRF